MRAPYQGLIEEELSPLTFLPLLLGSGFLTTSCRIKDLHRLCRAVFLSLSRASAPANHLLPISQISPGKHGRCPHSPAGRAGGPTPSLRAAAPPRYVMSPRGPGYVVSRPDYVAPGRTGGANVAQCVAKRLIYQGRAPRTERSTPPPRWWGMRPYTTHRALWGGLCGHMQRSAR